MLPAQIEWQKNVDITPWLAVMSMDEAIDLQAHTIYLWTQWSGAAHGALIARYDEWITRAQRDLAKITDPSERGRVEAAIALLEEVSETLDVYERHGRVEGV